MDQVPVTRGDRPIEMPTPGPGMPREDWRFAVWLIPFAVPILTILAILLGALWR